nr:phospholipase-like protein [Tanacetum cinerariifolium]
MNIVAKNLATHVRERDQLIGELDNCLGSTTAYESAKLLREMNDDDLAKARFGVFSFSCCSKGDMKFKDRVFPHRVIFMGRLMVNEVDDILMRLVDSLESWNAFSWGEHIWMHLYDEFLNVVFNHKSEHLEGLHKSRNYVPTYTLSGFVWAFKDRFIKEKKRVRLEEKKILMLEEEHALEVKKRWDEDNGDYPLHVVAQVSLAETAPNVIPTLEDLKFWTAEEKKTRKIDHLARSLLIQGLPNDIYSLIDSNKTAKDLWDALERQMRGSEYG